MTRPRRSVATLRSLSPQGVLSIPGVRLACAAALQAQSLLHTVVQRARIFRRSLPGRSFSNSLLQTHFEKSLRMSGWLSYFGGRRDTNTAARDAIVALRTQVTTLEKKEEYLFQQAEVELSKARANASSNKSGSSPG